MANSTNSTFSSLCNKLLSCCLILLCTNFSFSFAQDYNDDNISLAEGLSQSSVFCLSQDRQGFLWVGTQDGLNKYDGLNFKTYYNIPFDSGSLSSGQVISMLHDSKGRFWVGTANHGLNLYLPGKDQFMTFSANENSKSALLNNAIHVIYEGPGGTIWIGTGNGLQRVIVSGKNNEKPIVEFETVFRDTSKTELFSISTIYENDFGEVWVGTLRGLLNLSFKNKNSFLPEGAYIYTKANGLPSNQITAFQIDQFGNYWIGTSRGLCVLNSQTNKIIEVELPCNGPVSMPEITNFCTSHDGTFWIATGWGLFTVKQNEVKNAFEKTPRPSPFIFKTKQYDSGILSIREDRICKGIIWLGTGASGLVKLSSTAGKNIYTNHLHEVLSTAFVFSILKDKDDIVWVGTTNGLIRFNKKADQYKYFTSKYDHDRALGSDYITNLRIDKTDQLWIGTQRGLYKIHARNSANPTFERITVNPNFPEANVRKLTFDAKGDLLVVLPGRLYHYSITKNQSTHIVGVSMEGRKLPPGFLYMCAMVDSRENLWLGTSQGLYIYKKTSQGNYDTNSPLVFKHNPKDTNGLRSHTINDIYQDQKGRVWLSTPNGITKAEYKDGKIRFANYSTRDGLKNNAVYGVLENPEDGTLWMSTNGGLSKFDAEKIKFNNYDIHDGLQSNEFNGGAFFRAYDNELLFGGVDGYSSFYPGEIHEDSIAPKVFITGFSLTGEKKVNMNINQNKKIELQYNQNSFNINFIALQYANPSQNKYAYRLEGFQKDWTENDKSNQVNFSQLPPGEYNFQVIGSNSDGVVSADVASIAIIIHPPFWKTIWFYVLIAAFISIVAWLLHAYLLKIKLKQLEEIEMIRKETAADFHDELGHKLTTISWFGEILKKKIEPEEKEQRLHLERIIDTAGGLYHTMRDMVWALDPGQDSMKDLYKQIREFGESLFDQTGVEFKAHELNGEFKEVNIPLTQKRHVLLIFKEAMHNSFKHSQGKQVKLNLFRENNHVTFILEDNGIGFNLDWKETGNGLKNVKKRAEQIGGKLNITSGKNGTMLELEVPLKS